jgi:hypothetical protein
MNSPVKRNNSPRPALRTRDRLLAWLVTGPVGRLVSFFADFAVLLVKVPLNKVRRR